MGTAANPSMNEDVSVIIKTKTLLQDTSVRIFVEAQVVGSSQPMSVSQFLSGFIFNYALLPDYNTRDVLERKNIKLLTGSVKNTTENVFQFQFDVASLKQEHALLLLEINNVLTSRKLLQDVPLQFKVNHLSDRYGVFDKDGRFPTIKNYATTQDTLQVMDLKRTASRLTVMRYNQDFEPAPSPMGTAAKSVARTLQADSIFTISSNTLMVFKKPGLYFFQEDTTQNTGVSIWIGDKRYPRYTYPTDLVKSLIYISTKNELKELQSTTAPKKTLDSYWLRLTSNSETRAKRSIRAYYSRVATVNRLFTSYKEGWKTDMGMIYIVLGQPDQVSRLRDKEVWTYTQNANFSEINFTFLRRANQFTEDYFELVRYVEYEPIWYPVVEEWRKGVVE